jgi:hypothetical protein
MNVVKWMRSASVTNYPTLVLVSPTHVSTILHNVKILYCVLCANSAELVG